MRSFHALLLLLALATAGALAWHGLAADPGYVQIVWRGWSIESTVLVAIAAVLVSWLLLRTLLWLVRAPLRVLREGSSRRARLRLADGLQALREGRWQRADKLLKRAAQHPEFTLVASIEAARAARERGDADAVEAWLGSLRGEALAEIERAEDLLAAGQHAAACRLLEAQAANAELPPRGWWLRVKALIACDRLDEALALLPELRRLKLLPEPAMSAEEARLAAAALTGAVDYASLRRARRTLPRALRRAPEVIAAYAERSAALGLIDVAAKAIERSMAREWSEPLAGLYGRLPGEEFPRRLQAAEGWLESHPDSPGLLLSLGRLCRADGLWGKAEDYLERALKCGAGAEAWEEIGAVFAAQQEEGRARLALSNALRAARGEPALPLPARTRGPVEGAQHLEERSSMGVPRLAPRQATREYEGEV